MANYRMQGSGLYDLSNKLIAYVAGNLIRDSRNNNALGSFRGNEVQDSAGRPIAEVQGDDIVNPNHRQIGSLEDVRSAIDSIRSPVEGAALWLLVIQTSLR